MCFSRLTDSNLADCSIAESGGVERKGGGGQLSHMETVTSSIAQKHTRTHRHKNGIFMWLGNYGIRPVMHTGFKFAPCHDAFTSSVHQTRGCQLHALIFKKQIEEHLTEEENICVTAVCHWMLDTLHRMLTHVLVVCFFPHT